MFALEVGRLGYCPHSFLHCFNALGLPNSAARRIRSKASKTVLRLSRVLFLCKGMSTSECKAVLYWTLLTVFRIFVIFFIFLCFAISISHRSHPETTHSVSKHTRNTPRFSISPTVRRTLNSVRTPVFCVLPSGTNHKAASRLRFVSFSLRGLNDACSGRRLVDLSF